MCCPLHCLESVQGLRKGCNQEVKHIGSQLSSIRSEDGAGDVDGTSFFWRSRDRLDKINPIINGFNSDRIAANVISI